MPYAGHIDRDSSSASQNVEATDGAVGVVAEAETSNRGQCKKAAKAAKNHGLLARFFDETVPHKKRVWLIHLQSSNFVLFAIFETAF